ncbi:MAG: hypothetical protein ABEJ90_00850 [Halobacterium sp.]
MSEVNLRASARKWVPFGVLTGLLVAAAAVWQGVPPLLLGMVLFGVPLVVVTLTIGVTDTGIETAASMSRLGRSPGNPTQYDPGEVLPIPNKLGVVLWLSGAGVVGLAVLVASA